VADVTGGYPRPITSIHQVEISTRCNLRCTYCPSRHLDKPIDKGGSGRAKIDISMAHYKRALDWARYFEDRGTQGELALTGIGEALLHPDFVEFLRLAREALPHNLITFSTNGLLLDDELCSAIEPYQPAVYVSTHRPEKAGPAINAARRHGLLAGTNTAFATEAFDWAGEVKWEVSIPPDTVTCEYLRTGWAVVLSDGRMATCCLDAEGASTVGHVDDEPGSLSIAPWAGVKQGCASCHMRVPEAAELR
jgi:Radical SAM superfamily